MEQRFEVARLLDQGDIYSDVLEQTGVSSATVSRVKRCLNYGAGGDRQVLDPDERRGRHEQLRRIGGLVRQSHRGRGL